MSTSIKIFNWRDWELVCLRSMDLCFTRHSIDFSSQKILIAVSGGADSMALALLTRLWTQRYRPSLTVLAATIDHGLRAESASEAHTVVKQLSYHDIPTKIISIKPTVLPHSNIQSIARRWRFKALQNYCNQIDASVLMLGHNKCDQAETVLDRLTRGSHMLGLSAMAEYRRVHSIRGYLAIIRPLLSQESEMLRSYCIYRTVKFINDPSNYDCRFRRVRLRQMIKSHPSLKHAVLRVQKSAKKYASIELAACRQLLLKTTYRPLIKSEYGIVYIDRTFITAVPILQRRLIASILRYISQHEYPPRYKKINTLCNLMIKDLKAFCLSGVLIRSLSSGWWLQREITQLPQACILTTGQKYCWDNRLDIIAKRPVIVRSARRKEISHFTFQLSGWLSDHIDVYKLCDPRVLCALENIETKYVHVVTTGKAHNNQQNIHSSNWQQCKDFYYRWSPKVVFVEELYRSGLLFDELYPIS